MSGRKIKVWIATGVAALALLTGGLLFGSTLVSAQEPTPPAAGQPATPQTAPQDRAPSDDGTRPDKGECDHDGDGQPEAQGSSTGVRFRGGGRGLAQ